MTLVYNHLTKALHKAVKLLPDGVDDADTYRADIKVAVTDQPRLDAQEGFDSITPLVE